LTITDRDALIAALAAGVNVPFSKASLSATVGRTYSAFRIAGNPVGGSTPSSTGAALDRTTAGALAIPTASNVTYLTNLNIVGQQLNAVMLYDRLVETAALSGTTTTAQTVNSASLPTRNTTGDGAELWLEVYTALGGSPSATVTASYTNQAGTSGRTATLVGGILASLAANTTQRMTLAAGDTGVRSVQSVTSTTSTGTAGSFGVTIRQPITMAMMTGQASSANGITRGPWDLGLPVIPDAACLELVLIPSAAATGLLFGGLRIAQA
jgi:hypothetical protein